ARAAELAAAAGGREDVIVGVVAPIVQVAVEVPRDDGVVATGEEFFDFGKAGWIVVEPKGVVHEDERPAGVVVLFESLSHRFDLMVGDDFALFAGGVERQEENVLVEER